MSRAMLTTTDNPWNPFTRYDEWYAFDEVEKRYQTCGILASFCSPDYETTEDEQEDEIENAIDRIIELFPFGPLNGGLDTNGKQILYRKVYEDSFSSEKKA